MKRLLHFAGLIVIFIAFFNSGNAQTIIGNQASTSYSYNSPMYGNYEYGWSSSIYLKSEIAAPAGGSLSSISLFVYNTPSNYVMTDQRIYVRHVPIGTAAYSTSTYDGTAGFTLVYDGSITFNGTGKKTIVFTTPFHYDGTSNLEFLYENKKGSYASGYPSFRVTPTSDYRTKRDFKITGFPTTCSSCARVNFIPNIELTIQPCAYNAGIVTPTSPTVFIGNSATLNLAGQSLGATIQWQSSSDNLFFTNAVGATDIQYTANNVMQSTYYRALVTFPSGCKYVTSSALVNIDVSNLTTSTIDGGTVAFDKYPFNGYYDYSWASMLYKASEIKSTGKLSRISFYVDNSPVNETMKNQKIYVRHTTTSEYTETGYPNPTPTSTTGFTLVYDGSITYNGTGWKEIVLQNVFEYNGVDDLEFLFENRDGSWTSNYPIFRGKSGMPEYRVKRDFKLLSFPSTCTDCGKFQNILDLKMKFIPCGINGGSLSAAATSVRAGENVQLTLLDQSQNGTIQWEQSSDNITFTLIPNQTGITCTVPMTILPLYVRTVTKDVCSNYSNVVTVTPDNCFMASSSIGIGHLETEKYPFNVFYNNSWSNVIYTKKEIGAAGKIASLSFNVTNSPINYITKNQTIYVRTKTDTVFTDSTYSGITGFTKIFEGNITYNGSGWKEIALTTPFDYDGESNLEFLFENKDGSWGDSYPKFEYSTGIYGFRVKRDFYDEGFPLTCKSCRKFQNIPNVKIKIEPLKPTAGEDLSTLKGASVQLNSSVSALINYSWKPDVSLNNVQDAQPTVAPTITTSYILNGTTVGGCLFADTVIVTVADSIYVTDLILNHSKGSLDRVIAKAIESANLGNDVYILFNISANSQGNSIYYLNQQMQAINFSQGSITFKKAFQAKGTQGIQFGPFFSTEFMILEFLGRAELDFENLETQSSITTASLYYELKRKIDSRFYKVNKTLRILPLNFYNYYAASDHTYKVYNSNREEKMSGVINLAAGKSNYILNLSSSLVTGYYTYELTNSKGDKVFCKFYFERKFTPRRDIEHDTQSY